MIIRKLSVQKEILLSENSITLDTPIQRIAGAAIIDNPFAGTFQNDLSALYQVGKDACDLLMEELLKQIDADSIVSYGKMAVVGVNGELEHGHAMLHPMLGGSVRGPLGGGEAIIPSNAKVSCAGASADIPLGHKDDLWSFDHFDGFSLTVADSPRPNEIMLLIALADGGRPLARIGKGRVTKLNQE